MKKRSENKPYWEMNAAELAAATREFDKPIALSKTRALTKTERARFEKAQKSPHRSIYILRGDGNSTVVRLDAKLATRALRYAAARKLTLSEVVNRSLKGLLAIVE